MAFTTTITRENWEKKVAHAEEKGYFYEYKEQSKHWDQRIPNLKLPCPGVFLVGTEIHNVIVLGVEESKTKHIPESCARYVKTDDCYILKCELVENANPT